MIPELEQRLKDFEAARHEIHDLVAGLDDEQFNRRVDDKRWSVVECVDHLLVVGWKMVPQLDAAVVRGRGRGWVAEGPFRYGALGNWFVKQMGDDRLPPRGGVRAPRIYVPRRRKDWKIPQAVEEFTNLQEKYSEIVRHADGLDLARIKVSSPVTRLIRLSLGQWLAGTAGHQRRHLWQAAQIKKELLR
ncbi:MAG: DinB family protein [Gemmatimonadota bacterium]|nr:MAG: DinB family protein [Gemmatimonadota bacterium]